MANPAATALLKELHNQGEAYKNGEMHSRSRILDLCRELTCELEEPGETFLRTQWSNAAYNVALRVAIDLEVFQTLSADDERPKTAEELAKPKGAHAMLVNRILRHLAATSTVLESAPNTYAHTRFSRALASGPLSDGVLYCLDDYAPVNAAAPTFLRETGWKNPADPRNIAYQKALGLSNGTTMFEHLAQTPEVAMRFGGMMAAQSAGKPMWADVGAYPVAERLSGVSPDDVLVVDIGGGKGHDLVGLRARHPDLPGRLVLQEMPYMVSQVKEPLEAQGVEVMEHDFNKDQPVGVAKAYFFHQILHDYDDETCVRILKQIIPAMKPGYSKILVNELVLPEQGAHWLTTALDIELMQCLASRERTLGEFEGLAKSAGLRIEGVWKFEGGYDSVVEMVVA